MSGAPGAAAFAAAEPDATALGGAFAAAEPDAETALAAGRALAEIAADGAVDGAEPAPPQAASMADSTGTKAQCFGFMARILPYERAGCNTYHCEAPN